MSNSHDFEIGDVVTLVEQNERLQPPAGTVGTITSFFNAMGGPAAYIDWDCNAKYGHNRALLKHLMLHEIPEIEESNESVDILFGGVVV